MANTKHQFMQREGLLNPKPERVLHPLFIDKALSFFDPLDLAQVRYEMLRSARAEPTSVTEASKLFGFSREQFYKLERLFLARGYVSLLSSPRGRRPLIALNTEIISFIIHKKLEMPTLEMDELHAQIQNEFKVECSLRTVTRAMEKAGIQKGGPRSR